MSALILTTLAVNLRHVLMGATLRPWYGGLSPLQAYGSMFFLVDEGWALTLAELNAGGNRASFLVGAGLALKTRNLLVVMLAGVAVVWALRQAGG